MRIYLKRTYFDKNNSYFSLKAQFVLKVYDVNGKSLNFNYNIDNEKITVFGNYKSIHILYEK